MDEETTIWDLGMLIGVWTFIVLGVIAAIVAGSWIIGFLVGIIKQGYITAIGIQ